MRGEQTPSDRSYQVITIYEVVENNARVNGQSNAEVLARTIDEQVAKEILHADINGNGKVVRRPAIILPDGACFLLLSTVPVRVETSTEEAIKAIALNKLSPEERKTLGFQ
jgi:hypothetical protein